MQLSTSQSYYPTTIQHGAEANGVHTRVLIPDVHACVNSKEKTENESILSFPPSLQREDERVFKLFKKQGDPLLSPQKQS